MHVDPRERAALRILILGDVVGSPGRDAVKALVPQLRQAWSLDLVLANAENAASGSGITPRLFRELAQAGVDVMTLGDHAWKRRDNLEVLAKEPMLLRPHNYPAEAVGRGVTVVETADAIPVAVVTVLGRIFMGPVDCPFRTIDAALASLPDTVKIKIVEFHAEATSEKLAAAWYLDGRATCVFGTHTHVPTADDRILPGGTSYISDLGMTGPYDGVIGRSPEPVLHRFLTSMHATFTVADHNVHLCGILIEVDPTTGRTLRLRRVDIPFGEDTKEHSALLPLRAVSDTP
ncbi:MAG: TIGR00282 family metallophosphoesterase [Planctomycetota bacterium]